MGLLRVQANGPPSDLPAMCQVTFHLLERSAFQILSELAAARGLVFPGRSRLSQHFLDSPVPVSLVFFPSLYFFHFIIFGLM